MSERGVKRKLNLAVFVAKAFDDTFLTMMKTHDVELTYQVNTVQYSHDSRKILVSIPFATDHSIVMLISVLMHEAKHWSLNHAERWSVLKKCIIVPEELRMKDALLFMVWNIAADCEVFSLLHHFPVVRENNAIRAGKYPCSKVRSASAEEMMIEMIEREECRKEVLRFINGNHEQTEIE